MECQKCGVLLTEDIACCSGKNLCQNCCDCTEDAIDEEEGCAGDCSSCSSCK